MAEVNDFEVQGRWDKAWKIARWCQRHELSRADVERFTPSQWGSVAAAVGKNRPSDKTRGIVKAILSGDLEHSLREG